MDELCSTIVVCGQLWDVEAYFVMEGFIMSTITASVSSFITICLGHGSGVLRVFMLNERALSVTSV